MAGVGRPPGRIEGTAAAREGPARAASGHGTVSGAGRAAPRAGTLRPDPAGYLRPRARPTRRGARANGGTLRLLFVPAAAFLLSACGSGQGSGCPERLRTTVETRDSGNDGSADARWTTTWRYDADGRLVGDDETREDASGPGAFVPAGSTKTTWMYDDAGRAASAEVEYDDAQGPARRVTRTYAYDALGRLARVTEEADLAPFDGKPDLRGAASCQYDLLGRLETVVFEVDTDLDGATDGTRTDRYEYEGASRLHLRRAVTADDYEPLVPDALPAVYRATATPHYAPDGVRIGQTTEIDVDGDGRTDIALEAVDVYAPVCP